MAMNEWYGATSGNEVEGAHLFVQDPTENTERDFRRSSTYTFTVPYWCIEYICCLYRPRCSWWDW